MLTQWLVLCSKPCRTMTNLSVKRNSVHGKRLFSDWF